MNFQKVLTSLVAFTGYISSIHLNVDSIHVSSKTIIVFYDEIHTCDDYCSGDECMEFYDYSKFNVISDEEDETVAYMNGSWVINVPLNSPTQALVWAEKRYGSKWATEAFYRRYTDACKSFKDPLDPMYYYFEEQNNCPFNVGDILTWKMKKIKIPVDLPPTFIGEWRILLAMEKEHEGKIRKQCIYFRADIHEI